MNETTTITINIKTANDHQWAEIGTLMKTMLHILDIAVEGKHEGNDFHFEITNAHPESITRSADDIKKHPLGAALL